MKLHYITDILEAFAPLSTQEAYDNAGLITGCVDMEVAGALVCVDVTEEVLDEAVAVGANLVIAHHPVVFRPLKSLAGDGNVARVMVKAVKNDIAIYACHTNLDRAQGGMSFMLAAILGVGSPRVLDPATGFGVVGTLPGPVDTMDFLQEVALKLSLHSLRYSVPHCEQVQKVALITGAGGDGLECAIAAGADVLLTADLRHDRFLAAAGHLTLADIGHYESEFCAIPLMIDIITKKIPNFAVRASAAAARNPVNYLVI